MSRMTQRALSGLFLITLLSACVSTGKYNEAVAERDAAVATSDSLAAAQAELQQAYDDLNQLLQDEIAASEVALKQLADGVEVQIPSDVLFASGSAMPSVSGDSRDQLMKLADYIKDTDFFVSVIGHTDSQQPTPRLAERYPTNWEMGGARAAVAARFLQEQGVEPSRIASVSRSQYEPIATNSTPEGRAQNRRIQIVLRNLPAGG